jgi:transposase
VGKRSGGNGMTRGDRRRNARRERLRGLLPRGGAVIGIDLAEDKQALAVIDHDVRVLARKTVMVKAFRLGEALDWAAAQAKVKGFERVAVACEPTGPRWMQVQRLWPSAACRWCASSRWSPILPVSSRITRRTRPMRVIAC